MGGERDRRPGFFATWLRFTFRPVRAFAAPPDQRSSWPPLGFALAVVALSGAIGGAGEELVVGEGLEAAVMGGLRGTVLGVVSTLLHLLLTSVVIHILLIVLRARNAPFRETFSCLALSTAPHLFGVVPFLGTVVASVWSLVVVTIGLSRVHGTHWLKALVAALSPVLGAVALALGLRVFVVEAFKVPSGAMLPTIVPGDHLFVTKLPYTPEPGDVVVFEYPEKPTNDFIKRVIALPGDTMTVVGGHPTINGWPVPNCRVGEATLGHGGVGAAATRGTVFVEFLGDNAYLTFYEDGHYDGEQGPYKVAEGEVWVLGDNRNNSSDSRWWYGGKGGGVPLNSIKGRSSVAWLSFTETGAVDWSRFWLETHGDPVLPLGTTPPLHQKIAECLSKRPSRADATPPSAR